MRSPLHRLPDALVRILALFLLLVALVLVVRALLPPSMKDKRIFVHAAVEREMARPVHYAGSEVCAGCHDEYTVKKQGYHRNLSCETCHGVAQAHAESPMETKPGLPRLREFCVRCHAFDPSRPTGFPQINPAAHNPLKQCVSCHNPHDPKPPSVPQECEGCHGEIARTKAVSPHVQLECTTCHNVPDGHKITPRAVMASIPAGRDFCGRCHAKEAAMKETPKIDIATHGEKYLCWQCHYPHMPEVG
jgi:DnaJ-class molecular chaperone